MTAYAAGQLFRLTPVSTNTVSTTLNITANAVALGAKNIYMNGQPLAGGEIFAGVPLSVQYDGTQFNIVGNSYKRLKISPSGGGKNIAARTNSVTPNTKLDITADELILTNSNGNAIRVTSVSGTIDFGTVGANGLDASTQAVSTWYYGYVIAKEDGTVAVLGSTSATAPTMPTGYTFKALVTAARSNGSTQFLKYRQFGNRCFFEAAQNAVTSAAGSTTEQTVSLAAFIPSIALEYGLRVRDAISAGGGGAVASSLKLRYITTIEYFVQPINIATSGSLSIGGDPVFPNVSQQFFWLYLNVTNVNTVQLDIDVAWFKLPGGGE